MEFKHYINKNNLINRLLYIISILLLSLAMKVTFSEIKYIYYLLIALISINLSSKRYSRDISIGYFEDMLYREYQNFKYLRDTNYFYFEDNIKSKLKDLNIDININFYYVEDKKNIAFTSTLNGISAIVLTSRLIEEFTDEEIYVILYHELGHIINKDIDYAVKLREIENIVLFNYILIIILSTIQYIFNNNIHTIINMLYKLVFMFIIFFTIHIINKKISRNNELTADNYSIMLGGNPDDFFNVLLKIRDLDKKSSVFINTSLLKTHPDVKERKNNIINKYKKRP